MCDTEDDIQKKRKRSGKSSVSDLDTSTERSNTKKEKKRQKKKNNTPQTESENIIETTEEQTMESINKELKGINEKMKTMLTKDDPNLKTLIKETFKELKEDFLKSVSHRIDILEHKLFEKEQENDSLRDTIKKLEGKVEKEESKHRQTMKEVERNEVKMQGKFNEQEQYSRRNNVRITGLEEDGNESSDVTTSKVVEFVNKHMKDINLQKGDIDIAHRLGKKQDRKRQIIVRFVSRRHKEAIMKSKKLLKGSGIYVNEDLTKANQLALSCVRKKLPDEIESAWTRDGRIIYKNRMGNIHTLAFEEYQAWLDLPWPTSRH